MKILHAINMIFPVPGIINQMKSEQFAADAVGLEWDSRIFSGFSGEDRLVKQWKGCSKNRLLFKRDFYRWLYSIHEEYDVILLRHTPYDPFEYFFLKNCKRPVFLVLHTLYVAELSAKGGIRGAFQSIAERLIGPINFKKAFGIISVTKEIGQYASRQISKSDNFLIYPNGIFWKQCNFDARKLSLSLTPVIVLIASKIAPWHGINILISSMQFCRRNFVFHFIGEPSSDLVNYSLKDNRIVLHGYLESKDIEVIMMRSMVGVSSLAISSLGMKEACPLKTREYLLHGVPVYGTHTEPFPDSFKFYRKGYPSIDGILDFYEEIKGTSRNEIADSARPFIDKSCLVARLYSQILDALSSHGKN